MIGARARIAVGIAALTLGAHQAVAQTFTRNPDSASPILADVSSNYSGASWVDINNDGNLDLYVNNNFLYRGNGAGGFTKLTTSIGATIAPAWAMETRGPTTTTTGTWTCYVASQSSALYRNNGSGVFAQVTTAPMTPIILNRGWTPSWADLDNDGDLDLAITHPAGFVPPTGSPTDEPPIPEQWTAELRLHPRHHRADRHRLQLVHRGHLVGLRQRRRHRLLHRSRSGERHVAARLSVRESPDRNRDPERLRARSPTPPSAPTRRTARSGTGSTTTTTGISTPT